MDNNITMYGAEWCGDCRRSKRLLEELDIKFDYIKTDEVEGAVDRVLEYNNGAQSIPVIVFPDGTHLTEPSDPALRQKLVELGLVDSVD